MWAPRVGAVRVRPYPALVSSPPQPEVRRRLDAALGRMLAAPDRLTDPWLLLQNRLMGQLREQLAALLGPTAGQRVLDAGCGYGLFALELAERPGVQVLGVDSAADKLAVARRLAAGVRRSDGPPLDVRWLLGDVQRLPVATAAVDTAVSQLVFQHLPDPAAAARELHRVIRPGGQLLVYDVDDGYDVDWPVRDGPEAQLQDMVRRVQRAAGGDREIGRKLAGLLAAAGFTVTGVQVLVQGGFAPDSPQLREHLALRYASARPHALAAGVISAERYDALLAALADQPQTVRFTSSGQVLCTAVRG